MPDGAHVRVDVTGDAPPGGMIDGNVNNVQVGTIEKDGDVSFIVRQGATVNYTVSKTHYNTATGSFTAGANLNNKNEQDVSINLSKIIFTYKIESTGANINVTGNFTDDTGKVISKSISGTNTVTFKVWSGENTVSYTATKTYYETESGTINIAEDGSKSITFNTKKKYYASLSQTGEITFKNGTRDVTATWNNWNTDERNKASGTKWKCQPEGFEVTNLAKGDTNITYGDVQNSGGLPNSMTITFSNYTETHLWAPFVGNYAYVWYDKTFKIGTVYVEIDD